MHIQCLRVIFAFVLEVSPDAQSIAVRKRTRRRNCLVRNVQPSGRRFVSPSWDCFAAASLIRRTRSSRHKVRPLRPQLRPCRSRFRDEQLVRQIPFRRRESLDSPLSLNALEVEQSLFFTASALRPLCVRRSDPHGAPDSRRVPANADSAVWLSDGHIPCRDRVPHLLARVDKLRGLSSRAPSLPRYFYAQRFPKATDNIR